MMNILARILSHGFAIAVVVILAVGYIYRGELFPGMELPTFLYPGAPAPTEAEAPAGGVDRDALPSTEIAPAEVAVEPAPVEAAPAEVAVEPAPEQAPADTGMDAAATSTVGEPTPLDAPSPEVTDREPAAPDAPPAEIVPEEPAADDTVAPDDAAGEPEIPAVETAAPAEATPAEPEPEAFAGDAAAEATQPVEDVQETVSDSGDETVTDTVVPAADDETAADTDTIAPTADHAGATAPAMDASATPGEAADGPYQLLAAAREAFWMHDYAEAETKYRDLIALEPDNPDGYGELGNMYFSQGNWEQAADAYFSAGRKLIKAGRNQQAEMLVEVIRGLNGSQADELESLVNAASDTNR